MPGRAGRSCDRPRPGLHAILAAAVVLVVAGSASLGAADGPPRPAAWWTFDDAGDGSVVDRVSGLRDEFRGNFRLVAGVSGRAAKFDGYTTFVRRKAEAAPQIGDGFSVEAWVAVAAYPWNYCPVLVQEKDGRGLALEIGPRGEVLFRVSAGGKRRECLAAEKIPGRAWVHVAGVYRKGHGLEIFVNGKSAGRAAFAEPVDAAADADLLLGTVSEPKKPAAIHREFGTLPGWFSLDAILDDVKVYASALTADEIGRAFGSAPPAIPPEIAPRVLPSGPRPGPDRFGAVTTKLAYYWEWDELWRVADDPDVVVTFEGSPVRLVFWRGTRYSPAWVSENNLWMADQSLETWDGVEGCFEHMQDPRCTYSHVRILENTPARVVIDWRYAPVSASNHLWNVDPRTGWALWVDEYYTIYPDRAAVRKASWQRGSLRGPVQFQESLPLTGPGQVQGDVVNSDYVTVGNLAGDTQVYSFIANPPKTSTRKPPADPMMQMYNFKAQNKPFIIFEPGGEMGYFKDMNIESLAKPGACVHWPEGLLPCDGRTGLAADRATHFLGFPITDPEIHDGPGPRAWVNSLYGMTDRPFGEMVPLAKSWAKAPGLKVPSGELASDGYDMSQRAYVLTSLGRAASGPAEIEIAASPDSPLHNFCLVIKGWGEAGARLDLDGKTLGAKDGFRIGHVPTLSGADLVVWVEAQSTKPVRLTLRSVR